MRMTVRPSYFQNYTKHGVSLTRDICDALGVPADGKNERRRIFADQAYVCTGAVNAKNQRLTTVATLFSAAWDITL